MELILKNANVVDVDASKITRMDIGIQHNKIVAIEKNLMCDGAEVVDCSDQWVMPGLIDMHVHIKDSFAPLFTGAGITTVRNTSGSIVELQAMMDADLQAHTPRVITSDRLIDGPPGLWGPTSPYSVNIDDALSARAEVKRQVEAGADLIKVYGLLEGHVMEAVCDEAKKHKKHVSADLVNACKVNALEAAKLGVTWLEHASGILQAYCPQWSMKASEAVWKAMDWETFDDEKIDAICLELIGYGVKLCPTMVLYDQGYLDDNPWRPDNPIIDRLQENKGLMNQWHYIKQAGQIKNKIGVQHAFIKKVAKAYHTLGGTVVCGTDTPAGAYVYPGLALHRELELFVQSGFTEFEALRAATIVAADAMNREDIGRLSVGAIADMIILNGNPVENISNTQSLKLVIKGGKCYRPQSLMDAVPGDEENQKIMMALIQKFKDQGFNVDHFQ